VTAKVVFSLVHFLVFRHMSSIMSLIGIESSLIQNRIIQTHCGMRCAFCPPEKYSESSYSFRRRCLTTKWMKLQDDGSFERTFSQYKPDRIAKAIHLFRDPFSNIVSRFHLELEISGRAASQYDRTRDGFRNYCASIDDLHASNEKKMIFLDDEVLNVIRKVPCHGDFILYIEWHNLAFSTAGDLNLPTFVLHFESYSTRYNTTVKELLQFLELEQKSEPTVFGPELVAYDYFTSDERAALKEAYQLMASAQTWMHISQYFDIVNDDLTEK
jgi:hypothetical protein